MIIWGLQPALKVLKPYQNRDELKLILQFCFVSPQCYPVLKITGKFQDQPTETHKRNCNRKVWQSLWPWWETQLLLALGLAVAMLWMKESDSLFLIILSTKHLSCCRKVGRWIWKSMKSGTVPNITSRTWETIHPFRNCPLWGPFLQGH